MTRPRQISTREQLLALNQVPDAIPRPRGNRKLSLGTINRWVLRGIAGIRLEYIYIGGTRYTSREAIDRFSEAVTAAKQRRATPQSLSQAQRQAGAELDAIGI